jgi:hypothetical protein
MDLLRSHRAEASVFHTDVLTDPDALLKTTERLRSWLGAHPHEPVAGTTHGLNGTIPRGNA